MIKNKPPVRTRQLDRCDVCGDKVHREELVRTQVEFLDMKAENYLSYSSYNSDYWTVDDASAVTGSTGGSYGNRCDNARLTLDDDNNLTYLNPVATWEGSGTMRMTTASPSLSASGHVTFSCVFGPHEQNTSPGSTVVLGICDSDGNNKKPQRTWTDVSTVTRLWFNETKQTLEDYGVGDGNYDWYFYIQVTNDGKWWIDEMQLEANVGTLPLTDNQPENFVRTSGTYVSNQSERQLMTQRKVCSNCREAILSKSEKYGRTDQPPVAGPVETWNQDI